MIDFHCHIDLYPDPVQVRNECERRGIYVLSVTTTPSAWNGTSALAGNATTIRTAIGIHPQLAHQRRAELSLFDSIVPKTQYVGEIGLDGALEFRGGWESQVLVFTHVLSRCHQAGGRIMSIHSRRASGAVLDHLEAFPGAGTPVLHWYSGSVRDLDRAISQGCWFSVGPAMMASEKGRALVTRMPLDRILTESDGPFAKVNGRTLMPWDVATAIESLAKAWSLSFEEAERRLRSNLQNILAKHTNVQA